MKFAMLLCFSYESVDEMKEFATSKKQSAQIQHRVSWGKNRPVTHVPLYNRPAGRPYKERGKQEQKTLWNAREHDRTRQNKHRTNTRHQQNFYVSLLSLLGCTIPGQVIPVLHDLTICTLLCSTAWYSAHSQLPIIFSHLHILRAHGCIPSVVLTKLVTPVLEELHLKVSADYITPIDALHTSFNTLCLFIHVLLPKAVSAEEPEWARNPSKLLQKCTGIWSI